MNAATSRGTAAVFSSLAGVVLLAGCSSQTAAAGTDAEHYVDGAYSADGTYSPRAGLVEKVTVTLTLADNIITDVEVQGSPQEPESVQFQGRFIGGIADEVVGKSINDIHVSRVAGSSLTSGGFNMAIEEIKTEAAQ